jgi:hypothetical protein
MMGFKNDVVYAENINLSSSGEFSSDGELLIGSSVAPHVRMATLTAGSNITITNGNGTITIESTGGGGGGVASVTGTANRITSSGGANPAIDIAATYVGQASITTLGTIATGVWNGTTVGATFGGTGLNSYTTGDTLYASAANTLSKLAISTSPGVQLVSTGTAPVWFDPRTDVYLVDDFISGQNSPFGNTNYVQNLQNSANIGRTGVLNHPGVVTLNTGTNTNGAPGLSHGSTIIATSGRILLNFIGQIDTLSDGVDTYTLRIGLGNDGTATADFTDGAYFEYTHGTNSGNWQIKTANSSSRTTANTTTAADTSWHLYTIDMNAAGTSVSFYIDGVEVANSPIAADLPGNTRTFSDSYRIAKSLGNTSRTFRLDFTQLWVKCSSNRY